GPMAEDVMTSPRVAPAMIGLGLLELIPEADILALADPDDRNKDGISGKAQQTYSQNLKRVALGRFGWKAGMATIDEQNQAAFAGDIGISTPLHPNGFGECTQHQHECRTAPDGNSEQYEGLEAHKEVTDLVLTYARNLALPMRRDAADTQVLQGKRVFHQAGCAQCHTPSFTTGNEGSEPHLRNQHIWPYTDLLLHDMGEGLADNRPEGLANGREWRTAPLWGIGATEVVSGHTNFLHDGRARNLLEAILWHGGEAEASRDHVISLGTQDREALIRFLESM
ncbi:MAG: di-heme oxidoredictase family protein, partial [Gammaproteobacteria bacterium]